MEGAETDANLRNKKSKLISFWPGVPASGATIKKRCAAGGLPEINYCWRSCPVISHSDSRCSKDSSRRERALLDRLWTALGQRVLFSRRPGLLVSGQSAPLKDINKTGSTRTRTRTRRMQKRFKPDSAIGTFEEDWSCRPRHM